MHTLIELYDERPLENVLGVEVFRPERVVYVCPKRVARDKSIQRRLRDYFNHRGQAVDLEFVKADVFHADAILKTLRRVAASDPDCAVDITGGTDAVLYAAGLLGAESGVPAFTYSRRKNCFFNIRNAEYADELPCKVVYSVEDCFRMAGGSMREGRVDNGLLNRYREDFEPFFRLYLKHRRDWTKIVTFIQRLSQTAPEAPIPLEVSGPYEVKGERAARIEAPEEALRDLVEIGFLSQLQIVPKQSVAFRFRDKQIRTWLRDVGSVLELYVYKACLDSGLFDDVRSSAVVDWNGDETDHAVSNELDVMCTRGITPVFISCKTCLIRTEALNELAVLRDRFGGEIARAAIVTAEPAGASARNRAAELNIRVIDLNDLEDGLLGQDVQSLMNAR